jgi:hypothetical protein
MKFVNSESPVFTVEIINAVLQILVKKKKKDRCAEGASFGISALSPFSKTTPLTYIPLVHNSFLIHFDKLAIDFCRTYVFTFRD